MSAMTLDDWINAAERLDALLGNIADNPADWQLAREMLAATGPDQWLWEAPPALSAPLEAGLKNARWWARELADYEPVDSGQGKIAAVLSLRQHLQAVLGELKWLSARKAIAQA